MYGGGVSSRTSLGLYHRYSQWDVRRTCTEDGSSGSTGTPYSKIGKTQQKTSGKTSSRQFHRHCSEPETRGPGNRVQVAGPVRQPVEYHYRLARVRSPGSRFNLWPPSKLGAACALDIVSRRIERLDVLAPAQTGDAPPANLAGLTDSDGDYSYRRVYSSVWGHASTRGFRRWQQGILRNSGVLGSYIQEYSTHYYNGVVNSTAIPRRIHAPLSVEEGRDHQALYRQHGGDARGDKDVLKVASANGGTKKTSRISSETRDLATDGLPAVSLEPLCRSTLETEETLRLFPINPRDTGPLVGGGQRARQQTVVDGSRVPAPPSGVASVDAAKDPARPVSGNSGDSALAQAELASGARRVVSKPGNHTGGETVRSEAVVGNTPSVRITAPPTRGTLASTQAIATRLRTTAPGGGRTSSRLEEAAELIVAGYSDSRLQAQSGILVRFTAFCEADGVQWDEAGLHAMVPFLAELYATTQITGETATQYVSAINTAYETLGLAPPGRAPNATRLYFDVKRSLEGFTRKRVRTGGPLPSPTVPTPLSVAMALCDSTAHMLQRDNLAGARNSLANVIQFFMISRPTMTAAMTWTQVQFISNKTVHFVIPRLAPGRKNKKQPDKLIVRSIPDDVAAHRHPLTLLMQYRAAIETTCRRRKLPIPLGVWDVPGGPKRTAPANSSDMNFWLSTALKNVPHAALQGVNIMASSHRSGAATAAMKLRVDPAAICHVGDWELSGNTLRTTYFRPNLRCPQPLARHFFADLS